LTGIDTVDESVRTKRRLHNNWKPLRTAVEEWASLSFGLMFNEKRMEVHYCDRGPNPNLNLYWKRHPDCFDWDLIRDFVGFVRKAYCADLVVYCNGYDPYGLDECFEYESDGWRFVSHECFDVIAGIEVSNRTRLIFDSREEQWAFCEKGGQMAVFDPRDGN